MTLSLYTHTHLYVKCGVESHLQETLVILAEYTQERLLEYGSGKRIREDDNAVGGVGEGFHLEQADLIETTSEQVDGMSIVGSTFCKVPIKLQRRESEVTMIGNSVTAYFGWTLKVLGAIPIDIMM